MAEIIAKLGLDESKFSRGVEIARRRWFGFTGAINKDSNDVGNSMKRLLGVGSIIQGFRSTIDAAQAARDKAAELGRTVDDGTAAVARYGDAWDRIKRTISETAIAGLGFFVRAGEGVGEFINDNIASRLRGMTPKQARRTREISESAGANADRLSSPDAMAAAKARGDQRRSRDAEQAREVAREMNDGLSRREELAIRELPLTQQITALEEKRNALLKDYNDERQSALDRARAFSAAVKTEEEIARRRKDLEKEQAAEQERQHKARLAQLEKERQATEDLAEARVRARESASELATTKADALRFTVDQAAAGTRGNASDRVRARAIQRDEERARQLFDSGNTITEFDSKTQRNVKRTAGFYLERSLNMREGFTKLTSNEQKPFAGVEQKLDRANAHLAELEKLLKPQKLKER